MTARTNTAGRSASGTAAGATVYVGWRCPSDASRVGGWAAIVELPDEAEPLEIAGSETGSFATASVLELAAIIEGLARVPRDLPVTIVTPSWHVRDAVKRGGPGKHRPLMRRALEPWDGLFEVLRGRPSVDWRFVGKGKREAGLERAWEAAEKARVAAEEERAAGRGAFERIIASAPWSDEDAYDPGPRQYDPWKIKGGWRL
jgi:ribonuclease HI